MSRGEGRFSFFRVDLRFLHHAAALRTETAAFTSFQVVWHPSFSRRIG